MRKLKILLKIIALEIKKFFIVLDQKNIERIVKKLNRKCDYKLGFGIEYCRNYRNIDCDIFVRKNKKYVFVRQIYQKNCYANTYNDKLIREDDYRFSLYKLFDVDKSIGTYVCENQNDVSADNISYHLRIKKIPFIGINDKIKGEFLGDRISIDFSRGVTGEIVIETNIGVLRLSSQCSVLNTHELTKIEAEEFMKELNRFVRNVDVVNYNEFKRYPRGLVDNDEDYIESIPTSYTDVRQINKEINELKGEKKMEERNVNKFEAEYGHRYYALTFRSDSSDGVNVEFSNESVEDGRSPSIRVYKHNGDNGSDLVGEYVVDESPDFRGLVTVTDRGDHECVIPVKTYDGKKTYLVLSSEVDKRNPSYAKFVIGERGTYNMDSAQRELTTISELFSVSYMTANSQDTLALRELTHFVEKYIIPRTERNFQMYLSRGMVEKYITPGDRGVRIHISQENGRRRIVRVHADNDDNVAQQQ